ncbi:MAG: nucleotide pyrophosphohydrolase [Candidatus Lokiarchaeota archaeon]|nr:nucleotide pyrophosphohydrolase [Candidatus Lokiarchaeota archaeon]
MNTINDDYTTISFLKQEVNKFVIERDWCKYHTPKNLVQALNCEAGELSQLLLFKDHSRENILDNEDLLSKIRDEAADVLIYLISLVNSLGFDLTSAFIEKMKKNKKKYDILEFNDGKYYKK